MHDGFGDRRGFAGARRSMNHRDVTSRKTEPVGVLLRRIQVGDEPHVGLAVKTQ